MSKQKKYKCDNCSTYVTIDELREIECINTNALHMGQEDGFELHNACGITCMTEIRKEQIKSGDWDKIDGYSVDYLKEYYSRELVDPVTYQDRS